MKITHSILNSPKSVNHLPSLQFAFLGFGGGISLIVMIVMILMIVMEIKLKMLKMKMIGLANHQYQKDVGCPRNQIRLL